MCFGQNPMLLLPAAAVAAQVSKAVIAVPAKFTSEQRAATGAAYKAAGLKVRHTPPSARDFERVLTHPLTHSALTQPLTHSLTH